MGEFFPCVEQGCQIWFVFKPKIPIWVFFGGPWIGKYLCILWPFGIFYGDLGYFVTILYILCSFGTFFPVLVSCTKNNLATLVRRGKNLVPASHSRFEAKLASTFLSFLPLPR
jgi:hypothetical protein